MPDLDPAQRDKALSTIRRNVENQTKVIADLADISHISGGTLALQLQPVEVGALVEFAISGVSADAEAKKIRIAFVRPDSAEPASADPERLRQAVSNVLRNAVKFTPEGGTIDVVLSDSAGLVHISVRDSGPGIEHALLPHVFDHFRPVEGQVGRPGGLRLGLAIARALVELHGGTLRARNRGDFSGAEFTVSLPRAAEALSAAQFSPRYETTRPGNLPVDLSGLKVLLVDDEADSLQAHRHALERLGAQVLTAASVREALATLRSSRPDVLLADLGMPEEDGYALIKHVRMLPEDGGGAIPAAAVTGYASRDDHAHTLTAGFQAHVDKPVDLDVLAETVARLAGRTVET
jgi:CheY-like chemotaxis protein